MMRPPFALFVCAALVLQVGLLGAGCVAHGSANGETGAPPAVDVEQEEAGGVARVEHPEQFPLSAAEKYESRPTLSVTGVITNDVSRAVPVLSLASGRAVDVRVRLGDEVRQGQLLMRVKSADISGAFADYRHAVTDEVLARAQLDRAKVLYERGAIAQKDLEVAQDTEEKAMVDVETAAEHIRVLGADPAKPGDSSIVDITAPVSGVITEQNVTNAAGVRSLDATPNLFTISDLSRVWVVCDVYENDLPNVHLGDAADIRLNAYPDRVLTGRVGNILPVLDPNLRTAKVRIEVANPGLLRLGMFATAVFHGRSLELHTAVPASAILHMHDRDWVFEPAPDNAFRRVEVVGGDALAGNRQEVRSGLRPGQQVVSNALVLDRTITQ
jgi:cobalt-zinc-cadmium efflux system membrane fusion protein